MIDIPIPDSVDPNEDRERLVRDLLWPLWRGIDATYKMSYAQNIWDQFETRIRSSSREPTLAAFVSQIKRRMQIRIHQDDMQRVEALCASGRDRYLLTMLYKELGLLVIKVRLLNEERKQDFHEKQEGLENAHLSF